MSSRSKHAFPEWKDAYGGLLSQADSVNEVVNKTLFGEGTVMLEDLSPILTHMKNHQIPNIWNHIVQTFKIPQNDRLYKTCLKRSKHLYATSYNPVNVFIETLEIDDNYHSHNYLLERSKNESITYGTIPLYRWYATFAALRQTRSLPYTIEMKYLASFIHNIERDFKQPPFKVKRKDLSGLEDIRKFYNLPNIFECMVNIMELRFMLAESKITLNGSIHDLNIILDDVALGVGQSPKIMIKEIRNYLSFAVHLGGTYAEKPGFLQHLGTSLASNAFATRYQITSVDKKLATAFRNLPAYQKMREEGAQIFSSHKLDSLWKLCEALLTCDLDIPRPEQPQVITNFSRASVFLLSIMRIAGYGRGSKVLTAAKSAPEPEDPQAYIHVAQKFEDYIIRTHQEAVKTGFSPIDETSFIPSCISMWKTTGAGTQPVKITLNINGEEIQTRSSKKNLVGPALGDKSFKRQMIGSKNTILCPYKIGTRDVPYKPTRAIYPIPLPTIHAQVAVAMHMVKYVSTSPRITPMAGEEFSSGFIVTGSDDTSGVRIIDNADTLIASGSPTIISLDLDMSEFDAHNINSNFRSAILSALKKINTEAHFGPDKIPYLEMVEYAFGSGYVHQTHWDAGRVPLIALKTDDETIHQQMVQLYALTPRVVGERQATVSPTEGLAMLKPGTSWICQDPTIISPEHNHYFIASCVCDGTDLIYLESECSGELTTLLFNSLMNLAIQDVILERVKNTVLGKSLIIHKNRCIGDDVTIHFHLRDYNFSTADIEEFLQTCVEAVNSCGHVLNPLKTFFTFHKSEFVQTFAVKGLYIPKNQVMVIPSERPRIIEDPIGFSDGFRRLQETKVARGESHSSAIIITALHHSYVTRRRMHMTTIQFKNEFIEVKFPNHGPGARFSQHTFKCRKFVYTKHRFRQEYDETSEVFLAPSTSMLPHSCGGIGLCELFLPIIFYDALLIQQLSRFTSSTRDRLIALYSCFKNASSRSREKDQEPNVSISKIGDREVDFISLNLLFTQQQIHLAHMGRQAGIDLRRMSLTSVPSALLMRGLSFDPSVRKYRRPCEESNNINFLLALQSPLRGIANGMYIPDEYLIATTYSSEYRSPLGSTPSESQFDSLTINTFMHCHDHPVRKTLESFGLPSPSHSLHSKVSRTRMILSREHILRVVRTPEEIISSLTSAGIKTEADRGPAIYLLMLMGFQSTISSQLVDEFLNAESFIVDNAFFGSGTDDIMNLCNFISAGEFRLVGFPLELPIPLRYNFYLHAKMQILLDSFHGGTHNTVTEIRFLNIREQADQFDDLWQLKGVLTNYPRLKTYLTYVSQHSIHLTAQHVAALDEYHAR